MGRSRAKARGRAVKRRLRRRLDRQRGEEAMLSLLHRPERTASAGSSRAGAGAPRAARRASTAVPDPHQRTGRSPRKSDEESSERGAAMSVRRAAMPRIAAHPRFIRARMRSRASRMNFVREGMKVIAARMPRHTRTNDQHSRAFDRHRRGRRAHSGACEEQRQGNARHSRGYENQRRVSDGHSRSTPRAFTFETQSFPEDTSSEKWLLSTIREFAALRIDATAHSRSRVVASPVRKRASCRPAAGSLPTTSPTRDGRP